MTDEHVPRTAIGDTIDHVVGRVTAGVVDWLFRGVLGAPLVVDQLGRFADGDQTSSDVVAVQAVFGTTFLLLGVMQGLLGWTPGRWLVRHRVIVDDGALLVEPGSGEYLRRTPGHAAAAPAGMLEPEVDPRRNFGAEIIAPPGASTR